MIMQSALAKNCTLDEIIARQNRANFFNSRKKQRKEFLSVFVFLEIFLKSQ